jgi:hypothetical protein
MRLSDFYLLSSSLTSSSFSVTCPEIQNQEEWMKLQRGDLQSFSFPLYFKEVTGGAKRIKDLITAGWPGVYLISERIERSLRTNNITGWKTYDVRVQDKKGEFIEGYFGLSALGRCGPIDYSHCEIVDKRLVSTGPIVRVYKGLPIALETWDRTDLFLPDGSTAIVVTQKVKDVLRSIKATNLSFENLGAAEMIEAGVPVSQRRSM